jgi:hypothetical protein
MDTKQQKRIVKWFWPWQDERLEAWLRSMSQQGWHLAAAGWPARYTFVRGEPRDLLYRLDWQEASRQQMPNYLQLFADAGWEHAGSHAGWQIFRRPAAAGPAPEIFTDVDSKVAKYDRMIFAAGGAFAAVVVVMVTFLFYDRMDAVLGLLWAALALAAVYYAVVLAGLSRRTRQLKRRM